MTQARVAPCIVCLGTAPPEPVYEKWGHPIVRCPRCGLGTALRPERFDPATIYDEGYFQGAQRDGYADYLGSEKTLRAEFDRTARHLLAHRPEAGRLLEVGCAYGFFLDAASRFTCTGVEISDAARARCRQRGLAVFPSVAEAAGRGPFDVGVMLDCIEHLADPAEMVADVHRVLAPGGLLLVTTGDWGSWLARATGRHWRLMTPPQHLFYFSRVTLPALLERLGFTVVRCDRPWKFVPLGLAAYQVGSRLGVRVRALESISLGLPVNLFDTIRVLARKT
jgi:SAM-dependent methyltransferase